MVILSPVGAGTPRKPRHGSLAAAQGNRACSAFLDFLDFGVDHVVVARRLPGCVPYAPPTTPLAPPPGPPGVARPGSRSLGRLRSLGLGIHLFAQFLAGGHQRRGLVGDRVLVLALEG